MSRPMYEGSFRYRFMKKNILDRRAEGKRPWVREGALPHFMIMIYTLHTPSIQVDTWAYIDSTLSFLFIDKQNQNIRLHRLHVFVHTHLTCSKSLSFFGL